MDAKKRKMTTKTIASCGLLAALNIILARFISLMPDASTRFSIEAVPIFLSGILFGPLAGAMVGFSADFIGCLFTPFGYHPILSLPPILYGLAGGVFREFIYRKASLGRIFLAYFVPVLLGSVLYQSAALAALFFEGPFLKGFLSFLSTRSVQFSVVLILDTVITYLLIKSRVFETMGLRKTPAKDRGNKHECK